MDSLDFDIPIDTVDTGRTDPDPNPIQTQPYPLLPTLSQDPLGIYQIGDMENPGFDPTAPQTPHQPHPPESHTLFPTHSLESKSSAELMQNFKNSQKPTHSHKNPSALGILGFKYWQYYFDLDQYEFKARAIGALHPTSPSFLNQILQKPDLYGPFWISTFLVFLIDVSGQFFAMLWGAILGDKGRALYDFENLGFAASLIYSVLLIFPVYVSLVNRLFGSDVGLGTAICIYGYSNLSWVLATLVCMIPVVTVQWVALSFACVHSAAFLVTNFRGLEISEVGKSITTVSVIVMQGVLLLIFKNKFY
jgi:hypothetical protein